MDTINILKKGSLILELKLERCDHLVKKYRRACLDSDSTNNQVVDVCCGCLGGGDLKDMHTPYHNSANGTTEIYAHMLESCFGITVRVTKANHYICGTCITTLRESLKFKRQIIVAQNYFDTLEGSSTINKKRESSNQYCEDSLLRPVAIQENGYFKPILKIDPERLSNGETYEKFPKNKSPHQLWIDGKSMEFGVRGKCKEEEINDTTNKEPHVLLQGSQVFFKSQTVFLDATTNQQVADRQDEGIEQVKSESPNHTILGSYLSRNSGDVETVVVTPYISDMDVDTHTSEDDYRMDSLTEYLTSKDFTIQRSSRSNKHEGESDILDLIPFSGSCKCPLCLEQFHSIQERRVHIKEKHPRTPDKFMCEECGRIISSKGHLKTHIKNVHLKERRFVCNVCNRDFYRRDSFRRHLDKVHHITLQGTTLKPKPKVDKYECHCSTCGMLCTLDDLKYHICQVPQPQDDSHIAILPDVEEDDIFIL